MIEYREKLPLNKKWKQVEIYVPTDSIDYVMYDHRINGVIFDRNPTEEFFKLFEDEMLWLRLKGLKTKI